mgnify:CR=1 FL=1
MIGLVLGVLLFCGVHLIPSLAPSLRATWHGRLGENGYKGSFSLLLLAALALIVFGWRSAQPTMIYQPLPVLHQAGISLLNLAFLLLVVSTRPSRLRLIFRHPQLTGVLLWGVAHLLLNGDSRSLVLFGGLACWSVVEIIAINRREGAWVKTAPPAWSTELVTLLITAVVIVGIMAIHPWIAGMPVH